MKKILIILLVAIVAGGAALYFFVLREKPEPEEVSLQFQTGDPFTVNVKNSNRYLKTGVILIINSEEAVALINGEDSGAAKLAIIRDAILFILRGTTEDEIKDEGITSNAIEKRIITELNRVLGIDNIVDVLFNDFVMS